MSEFLADGRHTVDVTARVEVVGDAEARLGRDPEVKEGSEETLKELRWVEAVDLKELSLLPGWVKERLLVDAARGWPAGEAYLGSGEDE